MGAVVFMSHSHRDKPFARRLARRLRAYGVSVWIDEDELELGGILTWELKRAIRSASHVLVVASAAAAESKWVGEELRYARRGIFFRRPVVIPLFVADTEKHPRFDGILGREFKKQYLIDAAILDLARVPQNAEVLPDRGVLREGLSALSREVPALDPVIADCLGNAEMAASQAGCLNDGSVAFDDLEFTLVSGYEAATEERRPAVAWIAAVAFRRRGAGSRVIHLDMVAKKEGRPTTDGSSLSQAVRVPLGRENLDAALSLLAFATPPNDHALLAFIVRNFNQCDHLQRGALVRLMTAPDRGPGGFAGEAAYALFSRMPDRDDLRNLWYGWIRDGRFERRRKDDGEHSRLFNYLSKGMNQAPEVWEQFLEVLRSRVRELVRSGDQHNVWNALEYLKSAASARFSQIGIIREALESGPGSAEWDGWEHEDEMGIYVREFLKAASGDKDWYRAWGAAESTWKADQLFKAELRRRGLPS